MVEFVALPQKILRFTFFDFLIFRKNLRYYRCVPEFTKFNGDDIRATWEHVSQYILWLGEAGFHDALRVHLFSLSLT